jgi:hypothetical protein
MRETNNDHKANAAKKISKKLISQLEESIMSDKPGPLPPTQTFPGWLGIPPGPLPHAPTFGGWLSIPALRQYQQLKPGMTRRQLLRYQEFISTSSMCPSTRSFSVSEQKLDVDRQASFMASFASFENAFDSDRALFDLEQSSPTSPRESSTPGSSIASGRKSTMLSAAQTEKRLKKISLIDPEFHIPDL